MLSCATHVGGDNLDMKMKPYIQSRRADGVQIFNLRKVWAKLQLAARAIVAVDNPKDVCVISCRPFAQRAVLKFCQYTGATPIAGRFTPGTFTNQIEKTFLEPSLLLVSDPRVDHQAIRESAYVNIPVVAFVNTDSPLKYVDIAIPGNNKGNNSIGLMYWLLAREVLRLRGVIPRTIAWDVMVDLFIFREPEAVVAQEEEAAMPERIDQAVKSFDIDDGFTAIPDAVYSGDTMVINSSTQPALVNGFDNFGHSPVQGEQMTLPKGMPVVDDWGAATTNWDDPAH